MTEQTDESDQTESTRVECPQCGSLDGTPIAWGYPGAGTFEAADRGEVVLGGCVVSADDPTHSCTSCGYSWVHPDATRDPRSVLVEPDYAAAMPIPEETPPGRDPELMEHTVELLDELIDLTARVGRLLDDVDPPQVDGDLAGYPRLAMERQRFVNHVADYRQRRDQLLGKLRDMGSEGR